MARISVDAVHSGKGAPLSPFLNDRYGHKAQVTALMQEWVSTIGAAAGLNQGNTRLCSGAIGCPESRLELEVEMDSLADWEAFLSRIPVQDHTAWSQRMQGMVLDGSPSWEVYRVVPVVTGGPALEASTATLHPQLSTSAMPNGLLDGLNTASGLPWAAPPSRPGSASSGLFLPKAGQSVDDLDALVRATAGPGSTPDSPVAQPTTPSAADSGKAVTDNDDGEDADVVLDWKGEPMRIKKGDRLPRFL